MRKLTIVLFLLFPVISLTAMAQMQTFSREGIEFVLELPSPNWKAVPRLDVHEHVEFINGGNSANGYLHLRKNLVDAGTPAADLFSRDEKWSLRSLPGYVACQQCKGEKFDGQLSGLVFSYEYTDGGRPMAGRIYYLEVDNRTFYTLHFTGERDNLERIRTQMDSMARSFRMK
jgi:hypothetical protein